MAELWDVYDENRQKTGKVVERGTHEELLKTNAIYKEVYESQTKGSES